MNTITPTTEDYLQVIEALTEEGQAVIGARLAERLKVTPASVSQTIDRMARLGLVEVGPEHRLTLTAAGRKAANAIVRRPSPDGALPHGSAALELGGGARRGAPAGACDQRSGGSADVGGPGPSPDLPARRADPRQLPGGGRPGVVAVATLPPGASATLMRIADVIEEESELLEYCDSKGLRPGIPVSVVEQGPNGVVWCWRCRAAPSR